MSFYHIVLILIKMTTYYPSLPRKSPYRPSIVRHHFWWFQDNTVISFINVIRCKITMLSSNYLFLLSYPNLSPLPPWGHSKMIFECSEFIYFLLLRLILYIQKKKRKYSIIINLLIILPQTKIAKITLFHYLFFFLPFSIQSQKKTSQIYSDSEFQE